MKLRNRFALVIFGIILFLIVTPILVLYARGFKIDWQNHKIIKTGALVIKTQPTKAQIFLNDQKQSSVTPANIRFLLPGDYNIRVEKEGYQSWTKRLSVKSQLVTWANSDRDYLALFLTQPKLEQNLTGTNINFVNTENQITYLDGSQAKSINTDNGQTNQHAANPTPPPVQTPQQIRDYLKSLQIDLPIFTTGQIIPARGQIYLILDNALYLANGKLEKIYSPVTQASWDDSSNLLLYSNDNEIYVYHPDTKNSDLILRSLTPLKDAIFNAETGYIFFQNEGKIKTIEFDGRDHRNIFNLVDQTDPNGSFRVSKDGKKLFIFTQTQISYYTIR